MSAHRYWRINVTANADGYYAALSNLSMAATIGGSNQIGSGTPSASSYYSTGMSFPPSDAVAGISVFWLSGGGNLPEWWEYDFGSAVSVVEVKISATTYTTYSELARSPGTWTLQSSDDNSTWTAVQTFTAGTWTVGSTQTFDVAGVTPPINIPGIMIIA